MRLDHLPEIRKVFPDATIVWTHRDPITVLGSLCSLVESSQVMHERNPDLHAIGETWIRIQSTAIDRARKARVDWPRASFVDVPYPWLAAEPHDKVPLLYERLGAKWTDADARTTPSSRAPASAASTNTNSPATASRLIRWRTPSATTREWWKSSASTRRYL